jgi:hypothetical protein
LWGWQHSCTGLHVGVNFVGVAAQLHRHGGRLHLGSTASLSPANPISYKPHCKHQFREFSSVSCSKRGFLVFLVVTRVHSTSLVLLFLRRDSTKQSQHYCRCSMRCNNGCEPLAPTLPARGWLGRLSTLVAAASPHQPPPSPPREAAVGTTRVKVKEGDGGALPPPRVECPIRRLGAFASSAVAGW